MTSPSPASKQYQADLALIGGAARACGPLLRERFRAPVKTWAKSGGSPVTEVDLALDAQIKAALRGARPAYGWLSEETPDDPARLACSHVFIVDPLDGTLSFIKGKAEFCVAIAVAEAGRVVAGVVYDPIADISYEAALGQGAQANAAPIRVSTVMALGQGRVLAGKTLFAGQRGAAPQVEQKGALALRLALVAAGDFDAAISLGQKSEWDLAAGAILVGEAGGLITTQAGQSLRFNQPDPRNPGIVAAGPALHPLLIEHVREHSRVRL